MVVRYDDLHPIGIGKRNLRCGRYAVVAGHNHADAILLRLLYQMFIQPVAVMNPMRNGSVHLSPQGLYGPGQNIGRTDPVHIIVADNAD